MVQKKLEKENGIVTKYNEVKKIMKEEMMMKYKKIIPISINANSEKNLVLR